MDEKSVTIWLTGLPSSGKTTIAYILEGKIKSAGFRVEVLDGDKIRDTFSKGVGFSREERNRHLERVAFLCSLLNKHDVIVIASFVSPYKDIRAAIRTTIPNFIEVFVSCPLDVCIQRDVKGLYAKAIRGDIPLFTGISDPYEEPVNPEIKVESDKEAPTKSAKRIIDHLHDLGYPTEGMNMRVQTSKTRQFFDLLRKKLRARSSPKPGGNKHQKFFNH